MSNLGIDLARIGAVLNRHRVDYVVVGGMAVVLQGGEATTVDVDVAFDRSKENIELLADALEELSASPKRWATERFRLQLSDMAAMCLHLKSDAGDIDLIAKTPGLSFESLKHNCDLFEIENVIVPVASIAELIQIKRQIGRPKDTVHIAELEEILKLRNQSGCIDQYWFASARSYGGTHHPPATGGVLTGK